MPYIKTANGTLAAITVQPGTSGSSQYVYSYPDWVRKTFYCTNAKTLVRTKEFPAWSCAELGTTEELFTLLNGVKVVFHQNISNASIGALTNWHIDLEKDGVITRTVFSTSYSSVFTIIGIVYEPTFENSYASFAVGFDYSIDSTLTKGQRIFKIDDVLLGAIGNNFTGPDKFINKGESGNERTYLQFANLFLQSDYYKEEDVNPDPDPTDPYDYGGYSEPGGGPNPSGTGASGEGGKYDGTSDDISTPTLPTDVVSDSGLFTAYNPSASQLANFASKLWNADPTSLGDLFRLLFGGDAFNAIIGLHLLPVAPTVGSSQNIMLGNWDSGATAPKITSQYKQVNFGSVLLSEYWGNCIDYAPYTRVQLALPYIGIVDVDTDDVIGSINTLTYNIDVLSGAICATLHCVKGELNSVIYQWSGSCAVQLPITGSSFNNVIGSVLSVGATAVGVGAFAASGLGAALPAAAIGAGGFATVSGAAGNMFGTMKGKVQKSGGFSANSGALGIMTPYFIITRPIQSVPASWQADKGYPANISAQLGTVTGYTEVSEINLECSGTEAEKEEIIRLLKSGVIF